MMENVNSDTEITTMTREEYRTRGYDSPVLTKADDKDDNYT